MSVVLSRRDIRLISAPLEKTPFDMLPLGLFDMLPLLTENGTAKTSAASLTSVGEILSKPEVFLALTSLSSFLTFSAVENFPEFA